MNKRAVCCSDLFSPLGLGLLGSFVLPFFGFTQFEISKEVANLCHPLACGIRTYHSSDAQRPELQREMFKNQNRTVQLKMERTLDKCVLLIDCPWTLTLSTWFEDWKYKNLCLSLLLCFARQMPWPSGMVSAMRQGKSWNRVEVRASNLGSVFI